MARRGVLTSRTQGIGEETPALQDLALHAQLPDLEAQMPKLLMLGRHGGGDV
jgi:hypothetical protein